MSFIWAGCIDGSSIDMTKVDVLTVGKVQKHNDAGEPMFEVDDEKKPIMMLCVFAIIGQANYPIRLVDSMHDAQLTIQSILGKLKSEYDKEHGVIQVATGEEKKVLKIG